MARRIQFRRDTAAGWAAVNPILASGEPAFVVDGKVLKVGDGAASFSALLAFLADTPQGLEANIPAAGNRGAKYYSSDTDIWWRDDGAAWHAFPSRAVNNAAYVARVGGSADSLAVTGLTGSVAASRYVGATATGAPTTGAHLLGDWVIDQTGKVWICTAAGTPGTWIASGGASAAAVVQASQSVNTTGFTSATWTALAWNVNDVDTDFFHSTTVNTTRITIPAGKGGKYAIRGQVTFAGLAAGNQCNVCIIKNGAAPAAGTTLGETEAFANGASHTVTANTLLTLVAGDYIECFAYSLAAAPVYRGNGSNQSTSHFAAEFRGT